MSTDTHKETLGFQTEVTQLLNLMVHSLYSNKEIFLRELISNSSDAVDKLKFESLSDDALYENDSDTHIMIRFDKEARTISIEDNGIGMSRQEVIDNIGTIAKSGTRQFFESLTGDQVNDANMIGQFGVGFYSSFIVADKVILITRRAGLGTEHGVRWESTGEGEFTLETVEKAKRGTTVILHLKESEAEFLDAYRLRSIIRKYSDHITVPINMVKEKVEEPDKENEKEDEKIINAEVEKEEIETVNSASALWTKSKNDITEDEYKEFYKHVGHDFEDPLTYVHSRVEGKLEYTSLLYIPKRAPFDLWNRESRHGVKLYVRRVFIMDDAEQLMPSYLRFVKGVIDSNDLPLNVSREILQQNKTIDGIRNGSVKKVLGTLESLAKNDKEKYATFWKEFGNVIKEGPGEDFANREQIAGLIRFSSTHNNDDSQNVSLDDYISRMKEGQDKIYYISAENYTTAKNSPHLEIFRKKGIEVLLLHDRVDEWLVSSLTDYKEKHMQSIAKGELDLGKLEDEEEKKELEKKADEYKDLLKKIQDTLGEKVKEVRTSHRLDTSPACLVSDAYDMSSNLERILKEAGQHVPENKRIFEINPEHPIVVRLNKESDDERFKEWTEILFDQALLSEGGHLTDPASFVNRLNRMFLELTK